MSDVQEFAVEVDPTSGMQHGSLRIGEIEYLFTAFDDGSLRLYNVALFRAVGEGSIILQPFHSATARALSQENARKEMS